MEDGGWALTYLFFFTVFAHFEMLP